MSHAADQLRLEQRRRTHGALAPRLAALDDDALAALLAADAGSGRNHAHGGQSGVITVSGAKVFVKQIALTDLERPPGNQGSTANLFGLPLFYQYGVGSAGFGAWRELSAYRRAGAWALSGECPYFPLLYHWRVLPRTARPLSAEGRERIDRFVRYWDGSDAVRARLEAIAAASASIVLFLEHLPDTLHTWLGDKLSGAAPDEATEATILLFHDQMQQTAAFANARGMLHFDFNAYNVLTDGKQTYAADFGLALCEDFDLSPEERAFFENHRLYDRCYVAWAALGEWLAPEGKPPPVLTPALRAVVDRWAPVTTVFGCFIESLGKDKTAPYPRAALGTALSSIISATPR